MSTNKDKDAFLFSSSARKVTPKEFIGRALLEGSALLFLFGFGYVRRIVKGGDSK